MSSTDEGAGEAHECPWDGCGQSFDTDCGMKVHHSRIHGESLAEDAPAADGGPYECSVCGEVFESHNALGGHAVQHDTDHSEQSCPKCDRDFSSRQGLGVHMRRSHGVSLSEYEQKQSVRGSKYDCPACERPCKSRTALGIHYSTHDDMEPLKKLMIERLREFAEELGRVPKTEDLSSPDADIWTQGTYHERFGSVQTALKRAGLAKRGRYRNIQKDDLKAELRRVYEKIGGAPTTTVMNEIGEYSYNVYINKFGTWADACEAAGVPAPSFYGQDNPNWNGGKSVSDAVRKCIGSESWYATTQQVRERDNHTCQMCGEKASDRNLDVNHIVPIMSGGCSTDELLMALCIGCHRKMDTYIKKRLSTVLVDWPDDELPEGRGRWTPDDASERDGQTELPAFGDD